MLRDIKKIALENEARCSSCASIFFSIFSINIFGIICSCTLRYKLRLNPEVRVDSHGGLKVLYLITQAFFITVIGIQFGVLTIILRGDYLGLIGMVIPLIMANVGGLWSIYSAFTSYEKTYMEYSSVKFIC